MQNLTAPSFFRWGLTLTAWPAGEIMMRSKELSALFKGQSPVAVGQAQIDVHGVEAAGGRAVEPVSIMLEAGLVLQNKLSPRTAVADARCYHSTVLFAFRAPGIHWRQLR